MYRIGNYSQNLWPVCVVGWASFIRPRTFFYIFIIHFVWKCLKKTCSCVNSARLATLGLAYSSCYMTTASSETPNRCQKWLVLSVQVLQSFTPPPLKFGLFWKRTSPAQGSYQQNCAIPVGMAQHYSLGHQKWLSYLLVACYRYIKSVASPFFDFGTIL